jgi:hypothetical protein
LPARKVDFTFKYPLQKEREGERERKKENAIFIPYKATGRI